MLILGKESKRVENKWKLVEGSEKMLTKEMAKKAKVTIFVNKNFEEEFLSAKVTIGDQYVYFRVDSMCSLEAGDKVDVSTVRVYQLTYNGKVIERFYAERL